MVENIDDEMIKIACSDGKVTMPKSLVRYSETLMRDISAQPFICPVVSIQVMELVIDFLTVHDSSPLSIPVGPITNMSLSQSVGDRFNMITETSHANLLEMLKCSIELKITPLRDLCCTVFAARVQDSSVEEIREMFSIENDITPMEEITIKQDLKWIE